VFAVSWGVFMTTMLMITDNITGDPWPFYKFLIMFPSSCVIGIGMGYMVWINFKRNINSAQNNELTE
jgi:hypothetical protein